MTDRPLLAVEREILIKERATLLDRLTHVEGLLGVPSSLRSKEERRDERRGRGVYAKPDDRRCPRPEHGRDEETRR